jgi:hypothetical protein
MQKRIERILKSDISEQAKCLKLQVLALRLLAHSPAQKEVIAAYKAIEAKPGFEPYRPSK